MALLSRYPLTQRGVLEGEVWDIPRVMHARIEPLDLTVINLQDKAKFAGVWLRPRSQMPVGFGPGALDR